MAQADPSAPATLATGTLATAAVITGTARQTTFKLQLSRGVTAEVFTLAKPYRIIVDLPDVTFSLPEGTRTAGEGLVTAFRYGLISEGKARIVLDAARPVIIAKAGMSALPGGGVELTVELQPTTEQSFGGGTGERQSRQSGAATQAGATTTGALPPSRAARTRPVVLIDPGHGGIDGGAVGSATLIEKNVVLAVARQLQRRLASSGQFDVRMTRTTDVFISLDRRLQLSREQAADLFISLHADSIADTQYVQHVRGATVYTLSEKAPDEQARRMAEKENASDLIAGLDTTDQDAGEDVKGILIDLMKRETANYSADFSTILVDHLKKAIRMSRDPQRSAAFKVLKQTHAPSVLVELGYMSHDEDQKLLASPQWQGTAATTIAQAVESFFSKRSDGVAASGQQPDTGFKRPAAQP